MTSFFSLRRMMNRMKADAASLHQFSMSGALSIGASTAGQNDKHPNDRKVYKVDAALSVASAPVTCTADATANTIVKASHGLANGAILKFSSTGTLPAPLVAGTNYYVVGAASGTFQVSLTSGGSAIDLTTAGTGTISYVGVVTVDIKSGTDVIGTFTIAANATSKSLTTTDLPDAVLEAKKTLGFSVTGAGTGASGLTIDAETRGI